MSVINLAGFDIYLTRKRIRNINLRIDRLGQIKISIPLRCPLETVQQFLHTKKNWITTHQKRIQQLPPKPLTFETGEQHIFLGQAYHLKIHESAKNNRIELEGKHLCCYLKKPVSPENTRYLLSTWQRQQLQSLLPDLSHKWQTIIGVQAKEWRIRIMKTRWGSCNTHKKRICLNLHLIQYPLICLEYVIVHELVHLLEASHNQRFYAWMDQFMPEWRKYKNLLKNFQTH